MSNENKAISVKFRKFDDLDWVEIAAERIRSFTGVVKVEAVFPDTDDDRLKLLYVLQVAPSLVDHVLMRLKADPNVELAFEPPARTS